MRALYAVEGIARRPDSDDYRGFGNEHGKTISDGDSVGLPGGRLGVARP